VVVGVGRSPELCVRVDNQSMAANLCLTDSVILRCRGDFGCSIIWPRKDHLLGLSIFKWVTRFDRPTNMTQHMPFSSALSKACDWTKRGSECCIWVMLIFLLGTRGNRLFGGNTVFILDFLLVWPVPHFFLIYLSRTIARDSRDY
jgi:hypothetical protein